MNNSNKKKISLTVLLTGLVAIAVTLTIGITLFTSYQSEKLTLIDTTLTMNYSNAEDISVTIDSLFKSMRKTLQSTSMYFTKHMDDPEQLQEYLDLSRRSSGYFNSIFRIDENGELLELSPQSIQMTGQFLTSDAIKDALTTHSPSISPPYIAATGRLILLMSEPVYDSHNVYRGLIGGVIYLQEDNVLNSILRNNKVDGLGSYYYVVGPTGRLLYHPDKSRLGDDASSNRVIDKLIHSKNGKEIVVNTKGIVNLAGYVVVPDIGWGVVSQTPITTVYQELNQHISKLVLYTLPPALLLMVLAIVLARKLAKPFVSLANVVDLFSKSGKMAPLHSGNHWNREADILTKTIMTAIHKMKEQTEQLSEAALTDSLTGLKNRRAMESVMQKWIHDGVKYAIILLDIDHFKAVNDTHGHQIGDEVIHHVVRVMISSACDRDICCRLGGEEFVVLLPEMSAGEAFTIAERIRTTLENTVSPTGKQVTASMGISESVSPTDSPSYLLHLADLSLYEAKKAGRNKTMVSRQAQ